MANIKFTDLPNLANVTANTIIPVVESNVNYTVTGANLLNWTSNVDTLSATGNVSGNNLFATGVVSAAGNVRGGNINTTGAVSAAGNVTGAFILGDGSQLTNLPVGNYSNANVAAYLPTYTGNLSGGNISATGNTTAAFFIGDGRYITNLPLGDYSNANVAAFLPTYTGDLTAANVTANLIGNGSKITNIPAANIVGTVAQANIVTNPSQPNITSVGTLTGLNTGTLDVTGQFTSNANAQFNGNVFFAGNVTIPGNINQISGNSAQFFGNVTTGFGALYAGLPAGYTLLNQEITQFAASFSGYTQVSLRNISGGDQATGDFVVTADNGTDTTNYVNMGFTNSTYNGLLANNSLGTSLFANDGYLYAQGNGTTGGNIVIGSNQRNGVIRFIANGQSNLANVVATISNTGVSVSGNITSNTAAVTGNVQGGNILTAGVVSATGNISGNFILGNGAFLSGIAGGTPAQIANGTSNVAIATNGGPVGMFVNGVRQFNLGATTIQIGQTTGNNSQALNAIGIGGFAGQTTQGSRAIAIGASAGQTTQGANAVAVGATAGSLNQSVNSVAIGQFAGANALGNNSIAIGFGAGNASQVANSIILNASGANMTATVSGFYVNPVRNDTGNVTNAVYYNTTTRELTFGPAGAGGSYGNANVATFLSAYGANTISSTGNVTAGTYFGNGGGLSNVVTSITAGSGISVNASTGAVTISATGGSNVTGAVTRVASSVATGSFGTTTEIISAQATIPAGTYTTGDVVDIIAQWVNNASANEQTFGNIYIGPNNGSLGGATQIYGGFNGSGANQFAKIQTRLEVVSSTNTRFFFTGAGAMNNVSYATGFGISPSSPVGSANINWATTQYVFFTCRNSSGAGTAGLASAGYQIYKA